MSLNVKRSLLPAILIAVGLLTTGAVHRAAAAGNGLVAAYSFNGGTGTTAPDLSGSGNDATLQHAVFVTSGKYGGAVSLNGTNALVTVPDSASLDLSSGMTIEAWVRATSFAASQTIVAKERLGGGFPYGLELESGISTGYVSTSSFASARGTRAIPLATWKFVAETYDGTTLRAYVDGTQVGSSAVSGAIAASTGQLSLGGDSVWGEYFAGRIDNVRIYNRALSAAELSSDQTTPVTVPAPPPPPSPAAAYALDERTGMTAADSSGNGNTATLNGAGWTASGKYTGAATFGASSILTATDTPSLDPTAGITLEAWVNPASFATSQTIVAKERPGGGFPWGLELDNGIPSAYVTAGTNAVATAPSALPLNAWSFVAATYDGSALTVWVNGTAVASTAVSGALATAPGTLSIGADAAWGEHFAGSIDNVRVYGVALTPSQLGTDMSTAISGSSSPPADTIPPSTPGGPATSNVTQTGITLSWSVSTDNVGVAGYDVYVNGSKAGSTATTSYAVGGLSCGTTYTLAVDAYDSAGNTSARGTTSAATSACSPPPPADRTPPSTPGGLATSNVTQTGFTLSWSASTDNVGVAGYDVYAGGSRTGTTSATSYVVTGRSCGTTYTLGVDAYDASGNTSAQGTMSATTSACSGGGGSTANVWIDKNGGSCGRSATPAGYVDATACGSFRGALNAAQPGDTVLVICNSGTSCTYAPETLSNSKGSNASRIAIQPAAGYTVAFQATSGSGSPVWLNELHNVNFTDVGFGTNNVGNGSSFDGNVRIDCSTNVTLTNATGRRFHMFEGNSNFVFNGGSWGGYSSPGEEDSSIGTTGAYGPTETCIGASAPTPTSVTFDGVSFHDVFWGVSEAAWGGSHPDCFEVNGYTANLTIENGQFYHCGNTFLSIYGNQGFNHNLVIQNNNFHDLDLYTWFGIAIHGGGLDATDQRCGNLAFRNNTYSPNNPNANGPYSPMYVQCAPDSGYAVTDVSGNTFDMNEYHGSSDGTCEVSHGSPYFTNWHANTWLRGTPCGS